MKYEDLQNAIYRWFQGVAGAEVIWEHDNGPRPPKRYVSLFGPRLVRESDPMSYQGELNAAGTDVEVTSTLAYSVYVTVTAHRCDAVSRAWELHQSLYLTDVDAVVAPLSFVEAEEVATIPALLEAQFEQRAQFTARFRVAASSTLLVPIVLEASASPCINLRTH